MSIIKAEDIRLKVRPVLLGLEHKYFYEGPCRFGQGEALQPGFDKFANEDLYTMFLNQLDKWKPEGVDVLEPIRVGRTDDWENTLEMWESMRLGMVDADVAFFFTNIGLDDIVVDFAMRFDTPVIVDPESAFSPITDCAALRAPHSPFPPHPRLRRRQGEGSRQGILRAPLLVRDHQAAERPAGQEGHPQHPHHAGHPLQFQRVLQQRGHLHQP